MHWRAQCHAKWPKCGRSAPCGNRTYVARPTLCDLPLPLSHRFVSDDRNPRYFSRCISHWKFATCNRLFFACRIVVLGLFKLNIKARHKIREFLNANLWSIHFIAFDIDWSWNIFTLHNFCSMLIEQLIDLEKVRTDNLKFRTDLWEWVMDGWSVTQ